MGQITRTKFGLVKRKVLTNAQIKSLQQTPIQIVAAPGAGLMIVPLGAVLVVKLVSDYTNIDATAFLRISTPTTGGTILEAFNEAVLAAVSGILAAGQDNVATNRQFGDNFGYDWSTFEDQPLAIMMGNGAAGDLHDGDPLNTLTVTVFYNVVPVA